MRFAEWEELDTKQEQALYEAWKEQKEHKEELVKIADQNAAFRHAELCSLIATAHRMKKKSGGELTQIDFLPEYIKKQQKSAQKQTEQQTAANLEAILKSMFPPKKKANG